MKSVVETYVGIWSILLFTILSSAFLSIHLNVIQARRICDNLKTYVQTTNGSFIGTEEYSSNSKSEDGSDILRDNAPSQPISFSNGSLYEYSYDIERCTISDAKSSGETFLYNDIYKIDFEYTYVVPLFGRQIYPMQIYTY